MNTCFEKHLQTAASVVVGTISTWRKFACTQFIAHSFDLIMPQFKKKKNVFDLFTYSKWNLMFLEL